MSAQGLIRADLHNHTHYSPDSILSPALLARMAQERGLGCVAVTDHNTVRGGLAARELAGTQVIVGEEVRSADGEILGLFLTEDVPPGLPAEETVRRIKEQGGVVGVPHPFDNLRSALRREKALALIDEIDFVEALNSRIVYGADNKKALEFARRHGKPASAASDAHSPRELGRAWVLMPAFEGPVEFLEALGHGELQGRLSSPLVHLISRYAVLRRLLGWRPG
jgi:hypothetical protein